MNTISPRPVLALGSLLFTGVSHSRGIHVKATGNDHADKIHLKARGNDKRAERLVPAAEGMIK
jgi:hypothetical protein